MTGWHVRHEGSPHAVPVAGPRRVLEGLRDGEWEGEDEVRGPADPAFVAIADHPQFAEAVAEMEPPAAPPADDSNLDMNPLIDVALVLLIFFILTTSYSSLKRAIDLPPAPEDKKPSQTIKKKDIEDRAFKVVVRMDRDKPVIEIDGRRGVGVDELDKAIADVVKTTKRTEMFADVSGDVPWGVEAKLYDAAKAADVHQIYWPRGK